jgi:hypothetical protein
MEDSMEEEAETLYDAIEVRAQRQRDAAAAENGVEDDSGTFGAWKEEGNSVDIARVMRLDKSFTQT